MHPAFTLKMWKRVLDRLDLIPGDETPPGGNGDPGNAGMELIDSGTISSPVEYLDIDLPSGYSFWQLYLVHWVLDDSPAGAFSTDGGETFLNDTDNFDTYRTRNGIFGVTNTLLNSTSEDALFAFGDNVQNAGGSVNVVLTIYPGSAALFPSVMEDNCSSEGGAASQRGVVLHELKTNATVPPVAARINHLRISPYGNGDIDPPTGGGTIDAGSYFLYGVPTP